MGRIPAACGDGCREGSSADDRLRLSFPAQREQAMEQKWEQLLRQDHSKLDSSEGDEDYREAVLTPEHR